MPDDPRALADGEKMIADMSDDALAEMWHGFILEAERLGALARGAHQELERRMLDRGASTLETQHWRGKMKAGAKRHFFIDDNPLPLRRRLAALLTEDEIRPAFVQPPTPPVPPIRVDHRALNELRKRGGEVAAAIDEERRTVQDDPRLVLERKKEVAAT